MKVFVTGATGVLGSHLVDHLRGVADELRILVRPGREVLEEASVKIFFGNLDSLDVLRAAVEGCDLVYHVAASLPISPPARLWHTNVVGSKHLLDACAKAGFHGRFVYTSSVSVYGPNPRPFTEASSRKPHNTYSQSKIICEDMTRWYAQRYGFEQTIARPTFMVSERDGKWRKIVRLLLSLPLIPLPWGGNFRAELVHDDDVARGMVLAGTHPKAAGEVFNFSTGEWLTARAITETLMEVANTWRPILPLPLGPFLKEWQRGLIYASLKAREMLGWQPRYLIRDIFASVLGAVESHLDMQGTKLHRGV